VTRAAPRKLAISDERCIATVSSLLPCFVLMVGLVEVAIDAPFA